MDRVDQMNALRRRPRVRSATIALVLLVGLLGTDVPAQAGHVREVPDRMCQTNGRVNDIRYVGRRVYFVGAFTRVRSGGTSVVRNNAAACNVRTGAILSWNPNLDRRAFRLARAPAGGPSAGDIYIGGEFNSVKGKIRRKVAKVGPVSGKARPWKPIVGGKVRALAVSRNGNRVFVGGPFLRVNGVARHHVAALNAKSGDLFSRWNPVVRRPAEGQGSPPSPGRCPPRCHPNVTALEVSRDGTKVYIGGTFGLVDGVSRNSIAAVNQRSGALSPWYPHAAGSGTRGVYSGGSFNQVYDIEALGNHVFLCGNYFALAGSASPNVGAAFASNGARDRGWLASTDGAVNACAVDESHLYVGGHFEKAGGRVARDTGRPRNHVAAFAASNGALHNWDPGANSKTGLYAVGTSASRVGIGGDFTKTGAGCAPVRGVACPHARQGFAQYSPT
jgi:hypothetical protein